MSEKEAIKNMDEYSQLKRPEDIPGLELSHRENLCAPYALDAIMEGRALDISFWEYAVQSQGTSERSLLVPLKDQEVIDYYQMHLRGKDYDMQEEEVRKFLQQQESLGVLLVTPGDRNSKKHVFSIKQWEWIKNVRK